MSASIAPAAAGRLLPSSETRPRMAKAHLRKADDSRWRVEIGSAIQRAMSLLGWSLKEFSSAVQRDPRQCARWIAGVERPQMDVLFAVESFRQPLVVAFAEMTGADVETVVRIRRKA